MDVLPVSGAGGSRRRYRNGRGTRLGGEHPLSLGGPQTWGGEVRYPLIFSLVRQVTRAQPRCVISLSLQEAAAYNGKG